MNDITQEQINDAIKGCMWLSDNRKIGMIEGICTGECEPCSRIIEKGKCPTLRTLFGTDKLLIKEVR